MPRKTLYALFVSVLLPACGGPALDEQAEELGASAQPLQALGYANTVGQSAVYLGPTTDRTCFLTGLHGDLMGADIYGNKDEAGVRVYISSGSWYLKAEYGHGNGVKGHATCIPTSPFLTRTRRFTGVSAQVNYNMNFIPRGPNTRCFLTEVIGIDGWAAYNGSYAKISPASQWYMGEAIDVWKSEINVGPQQDSTWSAHMTAVCIDLPVGEWLHFELEDGHSAPVTLTSSACGMTGVAGHFHGTPISAGVEVKLTGSSWQVTTTSNKKIWGDCYQ